MTSIFDTEERNPLFTLGDIEYTADVAGHGGPLIEPYINPQSQTSIMYDDDYNQTNLLGLMAPTRSRESFNQMDEVEKATALQGTKEELGLAWEGAVDMRTGKPTTIEESVTKLRGTVEPSILTFGAVGAKPSVQSHEFRHIAIDALRNKQPTEGMTEAQKNALEVLRTKMPSISQEESWNGMFDDYRDTDEEWHKQKFVNMAYNRADDPKELLDPEVVERYKKQRLSDLRRRGFEFIQIEAASQELEGHSPPKGTTWKEYYTKEFEQRFNKIRGTLDEVTPGYFRSLGIR